MGEKCAFCFVANGVHSANCIWVKACLVEGHPDYNPVPLDHELRLRALERAAENPSPEKKEKP